ncbi:hypothetical protein BMS3Bbin16_00879 [archaeon BMS3Bbin16]|nr:hypothetical protein BMS3Bbin16_00879 [archaeon BMS3Bbin16]
MEDSFEELKKQVVTFNVTILDRAFEQTMKNPETRVKIFIAYNLGLVLVKLTIIAGQGFLFLKYAGIV